MSIQIPVQIPLREKFKSSFYFLPSSLSLSVCWDLGAREVMAAEKDLGSLFCPLGHYCIQKDVALSSVAFVPLPPTQGAFTPPFSHQSPGFPISHHILIPPQGQRGRLGYPISCSEWWQVRVKSLWRISNQTPSYSEVGNGVTDSLGIVLRLTRLF